MEPGTPQPQFTLDGAPVTLAWNARSEALLSKHGYTYWTLVQALRARGTGFYALCVALHAALPSALAPAAPEDVGPMLKPPGAQEQAIAGLIALWKNYYLAPAEKKKRIEALMPWARAVMHGEIGRATLDYWTLSSIEITALAMASKGQLTAAEEAAKEAEAQRQFAAIARARCATKTTA